MTELRERWLLPALGRLLTGAVLPCLLAFVYFALTGGFGDASIGSVIGSMALLGAYNLPFVLACLAGVHLLAVRMHLQYTWWMPLAAWVAVIVQAQIALIRLGPSDQRLFSLFQGVVYLLVGIWQYRVSRAAAQAN
jgi:hypothetical protein